MARLLALIFVALLAFNAALLFSPDFYETVREQVSSVTSDSDGVPIASDVDSNDTTGSDTDSTSETSTVSTGMPVPGSDVDEMLVSYQSETYSFTLQVPTGWEPIDASQLTTLGFDYRSTQSFFSAGVGGGLAFLIVFEEELPTTMTLAEYEDFSRSRLEDERGIEWPPGVEVEIFGLCEGDDGCDLTTAGGLTARVIQFIDGQVLASRLLYVHEDTVAFNATFLVFASPDDFEALTPTVQAAFENFSTER